MAPDMELANFLSGNWIRAICGLKADAVRARRRGVGTARREYDSVTATLGLTMPISAREA